VPAREQAPPHPLYAVSRPLTDQGPVWLAVPLVAYPGGQGSHRYVATRRPLQPREPGP